MMNDLNHKSFEMKQKILEERFSLTLSFSKRYQMSTAVCYFRIHFPLEVQQKLNQDRSLRNTLMEKACRRLMRSVREVDTVTQINETDFILLIPDLTEIDSSIIIKRIIKEVATTYTLGLHHVGLSSNVGICFFPYNAKEMNELIRIAKVQMYEAEELGDNCYSIYNDILDPKAHRKVLIENELQYAFKRKQFYLAYQPQLNVSEKKVTGVEVLIRWNHPTLGEISPKEFLHLAEEKGILKKLFLWTLEEVCKEISTSENQYVCSINMSVNQLISEEITLDIQEIINKHQISPTQLMFEITEDIEIYTATKARKNLKRLYDTGYKIALDDFGNGYFSFADFIHLPFHHIKLDRNFVTSLKDSPKVESVASSIIFMAKKLGLTVVIEGVETPSQFAKWTDMDCNIVQGYYVGKPVRFNELNDLVQEIESSLKFTENSLADSIQKKDREFDETMSQYNKEIEEIKNRIMGEGI